MSYPMIAHASIQTASTSREATALDAVFANCHGPAGREATFRVGQPAHWHRAVQRWYTLDDRRREQGLLIRHDGRTYRVGSLEVRSVDRTGRGLGSDRHVLAYPVPYRSCRVA